MDSSAERCAPNSAWCSPTTDGEDKSTAWAHTWRARFEQLRVPLSTSADKLLEALFQDGLTCPEGDFKGGYFYLHEVDARGRILLNRSSGRFTALYLAPGKTHWEATPLDQFDFPDTGLGAAIWKVSSVQGRRAMNASGYEYIVYKIERHTTHGTFTDDGSPACCDGMNTKVHFILVLKDNTPIFHASSHLANDLDPRIPISCEAVYGVKHGDKLHTTIKKPRRKGGSYQTEVVDTKTIPLTDTFRAERWCEIE